MYICECGGIGSIVGEAPPVDDEKIIGVPGKQGFLGKRKHNGVVEFLSERENEGAQFVLTRRSGQNLAKRVASNKFWEPQESHGRVCSCDYRKAEML